MKADDFVLANTGDENEYYVEECGIWLDSCPNADN